MALQDPPSNRQKDWLGRGWAFPVSFDRATSSVAVSAFEEDIKQSIRVILSTAPGERVMRPDFGCGIYELVYDSPDQAMVTCIEATVREALTRYEARIELLNVSVDTTDYLVGQLVVQIEYRVRQTNQRDNLVFPYYFREGGSGQREGSRA